MVPIHPGRILRRELSARKLSANALARALRVPSGRIVDILNGKRSVTAETALRLGRYFGNAPQFWINLQAQYDLAVAMRDVGALVEREVQTAAWSGSTAVCGPDAARTAGRNQAGTVSGSYLNHFWTIIADSGGAVPWSRAPKRTTGSRRDGGRCRPSNGWSGLRRSQRGAAPARPCCRHARHWRR